MNTNEMRPLSGVKVVDFTIYVAAPAATCVMGYLGADIIKVETPKGDPYRVSGLGFGLPATADENPLYDTINAYKRGIALDMRTEKGKQIMRKMIEEADIFVTNYREKALKGMGLTYEDVKAINPKIVYGKVDGYGEKGPDTARAGFDATAFFARSGFSNACAYHDSPPGLFPSGAGDTITSMALAIGLLAAYSQAAKTGEGSKVTTSLYSSGLWTMASPIVRQGFDQTRPYYFGNPGFLAISADYRCKDGTWVRFCGMQAEAYWPSFCRALGLEEYIEDERFTTSKRMKEHNALGYQMISEKVALRTYDEWDPIFRANDLPYERVMTARQAAESEQAIVNDYVQKMDFPSRKNVYLPMPPFKISSMEDIKRERGPMVGEHTVEILKQLNYSDEEIADFLKDNAAKQA